MLIRPIPVAALVAMLIFVLVSCGSSPTPTPLYLTEVIPPCTPVLGSSVDPCEPDRGPFVMGGGIDEPFGLQYFLEGTSDTFVSTYSAAGKRISPAPYVAPPITSTFLQHTLTLVGIPVSLTS